MPAVGTGVSAPCFLSIKNMKFQDGDDRLPPHEVPPDKVDATGDHLTGYRPDNRTLTSARTNEIRLLIADDHPAIRTGLKAIFAATEINIVGEAVTSAEAVHKAITVPTDVVLLDLTLPDGNGLDALTRIKAVRPELPVLIYSMQSDDLSRRRALAAGASDYLVKGIATAEMVDAVRAAYGRAAEAPPLKKSLATTSTLESHNGATADSGSSAHILSDQLSGTGNHGGKILVVADCVDMQANLQDILQQEGYEVHFAEAPTGALRRADWPEFQVILLDGKLRGVSANETLTQLRRLAPGAAVIIMTGYLDLDSALAALRHGAADYLLKPINADALLAGISRIRRLQEAQEKAAQSHRLAAIGQMTAIVTHEGRSALQLARANLELLECEVAHLPRAVQLLGRVQNAQNQLRRLFDDIREFAAPLALVREPCNVRDLVRRALEETCRVSPERTVRLTEHLTEPDLVCDADPFRLNQVFRNLFENSLAACSDPVVLSVRYSTSQLAEGRAIEIVVEDNGPGLTGEQRRRLFEPFYTTKPKGTGLGLSIAQRIVEHHGGRLAAGPESSSGAQFIIVLPQAIFAPESAYAAAETEVDCRISS